MRIELTGDEAGPATLTAVEVAARLGLSTSTLYTYVQSRILPPPDITARPARWFVSTIEALPARRGKGWRKGQPSIAGQRCT